MMYTLRTKLLPIGAFVLGLAVGHATGALDALAQAAAACVQAGPTGQAVTLNGSGGMDSPPFALGGGSYRVAWQGDRGCVMIAELKHADGSDPRGKHLWSTTGQTSGEAWTYAVPPATYYLHMNSSCTTWSVTLEPQG